MVKACKTAATFLLPSLTATLVIPAIAAIPPGPGHNDADLVILLASTELKSTRKECRAVRPILN